MVLKAALVKRCRRRADFCDAVPWRFAVSAIRLHIAVVTLSQSRYAHELQCRTTVSAIEANLTSCLREKWNEKRKNAGVELNVLDLDDWVTVNSVAPQIRRPKKETKTAGKTEKTVNQPEAPREASVRPEDFGVRGLHVEDQPRAPRATFYTASLLRMLSALIRGRESEAPRLPSPAQMLYLQFDRPSPNLMRS
ncbi:Uncharacterized protein APZ42_031194 [Daphnia magna]|uniref:Uncharacterized protein n=1 Tax=Daphnia magna TaxID=35525 RepID=A0A164N2U1_9CRUS|nr:Uncharacterized protein APZ42_031194 [Daphnia magna]